MEIKGADTGEETETRVGVFGRGKRLHGATREAPVEERVGRIARSDIEVSEEFAKMIVVRVLLELEGTAVL